MPYLFINNSSRRPQFTKEEQLEENWKLIFGTVHPMVDQAEKRESEKSEKGDFTGVMVCRTCGVEKPYVMGMSAYCTECKTGILSFKKRMV